MIKPKLFKLYLEKLLIKLLLTLAKNYEIEMKSSSRKGQNL